MSSTLRKNGKAAYAILFLICKQVIWAAAGADKEKQRESDLHSNWEMARHSHDHNLLHTL